MTQPWIDITAPLGPELPGWPGDPSFERSVLADMHAGAFCNVSHLALSAHTGTHLDAPRHFIADGATIEEMPIDLMVGSCRVIDVGAVRRIEPILLQDVAIQPGERLLFRTANSARSWWREPFDRSYVHLSAEAARVLAEAGVGLVGIDALSIGQFEGDGVETHLELLGAGIWVLEGLDLSQVQGGDGELVCLPLRVEGADGAPARAIFRPST